MKYNNNVLITGGSSGIGLEVAKLFAKKGFNIMISSLDQNELDLAIFEIKKLNENISVE